MYLHYLQTIVDLLTKLPLSNWKTIILSSVSIAYLVIFKEHINPFIKKKIKITFPSELLLIIAATLVSYLARFNTYSISVVGKIP